MGDWVSFLIFAGLIYVMMRYGCGAHMTHGKHANHKSRDKDVDPVCGVEVDVEKGYGKMHDGTLYRFCSRSCLDEFEADPDRYLKQAKMNGGDV